MRAVSASCRSVAPAAVTAQVTDCPVSVCVDGKPLPGTAKYV